MKAAILAIGDELLGGRCLDTNSHWLAVQLARLQISLVETRCIADESSCIIEALRSVCEHVDLVILTGGLGPTPDDLTREALSEAIGQPLVSDEKAAEWIGRYFVDRSLPMADSQARLAQRPERAESYPNHVGTAPSLRCSLDRSGADPVVIWALPGPPAELQDAWSRHLEPWLIASASASATVEPVALKSFGLLEADFVVRLGDLADRNRAPRLGTRVSQDVFLLQIDPAGATREQTVMTATGCRDLLEPYLFGDGHQSLAESLGALLSERGQSMVTAESCTGGMIGASLVGVPGASEWYRGGWVTYANEMKSTCLDVSVECLESGGAVSEEVVRQMARQSRLHSGADWSVAVSGIAGPGGGTSDKPVGTVWIGWSGPDQLHSRLFRLGTDRSRIRMRAVMMSLQLLRWSVLGVDPMTPTAWDAP
ncbi:MAG: CinA family nicotinamide mononucleotide deamidase-related protein [Phycisphaerales bacterium]|nr:CinA family nicotinamide mononucleotide deamidase-related protein [Phycisphaerales bacterium]